MEYKESNKQFWGQHIWTRGYFTASSENVTDKIIKEYIQPTLAGIGSVLSMSKDIEFNYKNKKEF